MGHQVLENACKELLLYSAGQEVVDPLSKASGNFLLWFVRISLLTVMAGSHAGPCR